jgi:hypothetical protein
MGDSAFTSAGSVFGPSGTAVGAVIDSFMGQPAGSSQALGMSGTGDFIVNSPGAKAPAESNYASLIKYGGMVLIAIVLLKVFRGK